MNPTTNDIAAPTELNGIHLVTAKRALSTILYSIFASKTLSAKSIIKPYVPLLPKGSNENATLCQANKTFKVNMLIEHHSIMKHLDL